MTALFFYGTLRDPDLLRIVMGDGAAGASIQDAVMPGYAVYWAAGQSFPFITPDAQAQAQGILLTGLTDEAVARFDFYEGSFGYALKPVEVHTLTAAHLAQVYFPDPGQWERGAPFDIAAWQSTHGALNRLSAVEEMSYFGQMPASDLTWRVPMIRARAAARLAAAPGVPAAIRSDCGAHEVDHIAVSSSHAGFYLTQIHHLRYPNFAGGMGPALRREVFVAADAAIVLPYDPVRDRVLLVEQFRMGPFGRGDPRPWMLEPVAGYVDPGETPEAAAHRECTEEAGLHLHRLEKINSFYASPGGSTEYFHVFLGLCDLPELAQGSGGLDTEHEDIRTHVLPYAEAAHLLTTGEADNGPLILSLIWLAQNRDRLRAAA